MVCLFANTFRLQFSFSFFFFFFFLNTKIFYQNILAREIIMIDKFWFNWKSPSGFVGVALWKNGVILVDRFKLLHVMRWNLKKKVNGILWFEKLICDVLLLSMFWERGGHLLREFWILLILFFFYRWWNFEKNLWLWYYVAVCSGSCFNYSSFIYVMDESKYGRIWKVKSVVS